MAVHRGICARFEIDIATQTVVPVRELWKHVPARRNGKKLHCSTGYRWAAQGLPTIQIGGTLCTSVEALQWWCANRTAGEDEVIAPESPAARRKAEASVDRQLDAMGVK